MLWNAWAAGAVIVTIMTGLGCGEAGPDWIGTWVGEKSLPNEEKIPEAYKTTLKQVSLSLDANGHFVLVDSGIPYEGRYATDGPRVTMRVETMLNRRIGLSDPEYSRLREPMSLERSADGKFYFTDPGGFHRDPVEMKKKSSEAKPNKSS